MMIQIPNIVFGKGLIVTESCLVVIHNPPVLGGVKSLIAWGMKDLLSSSVDQD